MAKKKKKKSKNGRRRLGQRAIIGTFAGGLVGKVVEKLLADTIRDFILPDHHRHKKKRHADGDEDVAAELLQVLADGGPKPIPRLLADTKLALSPMLNALHTLRDFRLITFVGEPGDEVVEVTHTGAEAATVIRSNHIRSEANELLEA